MSSGLFQASQTESKLALTRVSTVIFTACLLSSWGCTRQPRLRAHESQPQYDDELTEVKIPVALIARGGHAAFGMTVSS
jgi:hypothetical protein